MEPDWIVLAHIWQRRGLMMMPAYIINALHHAFSLPTDPPFNEPEPPFYLFRDRCRKYDDSERTEEVIERAYKRGYPLYKPVYHELTVNSIEVDISKFPDPGVRLSPSTSQTAVWRWKYWYPAFTVFWALIFHLENEWLRRPQFIWQQLAALQHHFLYSEDTADEYHYFLSLYERLLGVQYDIRTNAPHYLVNVPDRIELKPAEQTERITLFANTINYLREQTEQELLHFQF